jgi:predicted house-cleaning noncanonical NTP pyrophosphatase (MazG superfamily)
MVNSFSDVEEIYKGVCKINTNKTGSYRSKLAIWLREFLLDLLEKPKESEVNHYLEIKSNITNFIKKAEEESPYSDLPELERNIISDMENYINSKNTEESKKKLSELTSAIQIRDESVKKLKIITRWSISLSILGVISTIIFGTLSFI